MDQSDHDINTTTSSIDDLTKTKQLLSSAFYSKDSALGLSDDNLIFQQTNEINKFNGNNNGDDDNNHHHQQQKQQQSISSFIKTDDQSKFY